MDDWKNALLSSGIPHYMHGGLTRWIEQGIPPGHFLTALLTNDLRETFERADDANVECIGDYLKFLYCHAPAGCWGSPERFDSWAKAHEEKRLA
jgi:hypothetical protein